MREAERKKENARLLLRIRPLHREASSSLGIFKGGGDLAWLRGIFPQREREGERVWGDFGENWSAGYLPCRFARSTLKAARLGYKDSSESFEGSRKLRTRSVEEEVSCVRLLGESTMAATTRAVTAIVLVFVVARTSGASLPLPDFIKPCSRNDPKLNECALAQGKSVIAKLKDGLPKYRIPKLEPLRVDEIRISQDESNGVGINLVAKEVDIHGLSEGQLRDISIQVEPPSFKLSFFFPLVEILNTYNVNGKILILPIQGNGKGNITMVNLDLGFDFTGEWVKKDDGPQFLKIGEHKMTYKMDRNYIKLDNLFNGNKALGDRMNEFLDANWREVTEELGPPIADALALVIKSIVAGIVEQVPFENIFPEKV